MQQMLVMKVALLQISRLMIVGLYKIWSFMFALTLYLQLCILGMQENKEGLELLKTAIEKAGYTGKVSKAKYLFSFNIHLLGG